MTTTTVKIYCPGPGIAWQSAVNDFQEWAAGTWDNIAVTLTTQNPWNSLSVDLTLGSDHTIRKYIIGTLDVGIVVPLAYIIQSSGWRAMPRPMPFAVGAVSTVQKWRDVMAAIRKSILTTWCIGAAPAWTERLGSGSFELDWVHFYTQFYNREIVTLDQMLIYVYSAPPTYDQLLGVPTDGLTTGNPLAIGGGGGSADLGPVVEALQTIADQDKDITLNNGGNTWTLRGNVRTGP